jgi:hypothetical protein
MKHVSLKTRWPNPRGAFGSSGGSSAGIRIPPARPANFEGWQPAAAKVLAALLDKLRSASARGRRGGLALIRTMAEKGGA